MKKSLLLLIPPLFALSGLSHAAPVGDLITNGSFEANHVDPGDLKYFFGVNSNYVYTGHDSWHNPAADLKQDVPGWDLGYEGLEIRNHFLDDAHDGHNYAELDVHNNSNISQTLHTTKGQKYKLSFWYSPRSGYGAYTNGIDAKWNGQTIKSITGNGGPTKYVNRNNKWYTNNTGHDQVWTQYTLDVTATSSSSVLSFFATGNSDCAGGSLDGVSLVALSAPPIPPVSPVPLPASSLLFAPALLGFIGLRRKAKKTVA